ncbi:MAG: hypothetical protein WDN69_03620 [Aliidongia sp.]
MSIASSRGAGTAPWPIATQCWETDTWYTGPSILLSRHRGIYDAFEIIAHAPIDDGVVKVWHGLLVKSPNEVATEADVAMARASQAAACAAFSQDFEVWSHKAPGLQRAAGVDRRAVRQGPIWYRQFYNPRARVEEFTRVVDGIHVVRGMDPAPSLAAE